MSQQVTSFTWQDLKNFPYGMSQHFIQRAASENRPLHALMQAGGGLNHTAMAGAQPKLLQLARGFGILKAEIKGNSSCISEFSSLLC